jgi:hypothetical protein
MPGQSECCRIKSLITHPTINKRERCYPLHAMPTQPVPRTRDRLLSLFSFLLQFTHAHALARPRSESSSNMGSLVRLRVSLTRVLSHTHAHTPNPSHQARVSAECLHCVTHTLDMLRPRTHFFFSLFTHTVHARLHFCSLTIRDSERCLILIFRRDNAPADDEFWMAKEDTEELSEGETHKRNGKIGCAIVP